MWLRFLNSLLTPAKHLATRRGKRASMLLKRLEDRNLLTFDFLTEHVCLSSCLFPRFAGE
jgi:hypothetical protein